MYPVIDHRFKLAPELIKSWTTSILLVADAFLGLKLFNKLNSKYTIIPAINAVIA